jgi:hypothetical protein
MLSKGQGNTIRTYEQLVRALEKDNRAEEAHKIWVKKIAHDLHSVPWRFCGLMLAIYYRNNMLDRLIKVWYSSSTLLKHVVVDVLVKSMYGKLKLHMKCLVY